MRIFLNQSAKTNLRRSLFSESLYVWDWFSVNSKQAFRSCMKKKQLHHILLTLTENFGNIPKVPKLFYLMKLIESAQKSSWAVGALLSFH